MLDCQALTRPSILAFSLLGCQALTNVLARTAGRQQLGLPPGRCPNADTCPKVAAGVGNGHNCTTLGLDPAACRGLGGGDRGGAGSGSGGRGGACC
jgi:hypothetical protein